ncbi:MAG: copper amine oxidase, partial [Thermoanaerobacterales bacterium]|nr:copper amine oxidase [Thermoanaerobacterales bacterium]
PVVVDGRQAQSRGMTQSEMANLMLKLGASDALNLDGGGSSTIVVRPLGEKLPQVINSVSQGAQRLITNGIGIFSNAPTSEVNGLKIVANSFNVPKNGHRSFEVRAYDENYNPVEIDQSDVSWTVTNGLGSFDGNVLFGQKSGTGLVTASYRGVTASQEIRILNDGALLSVQPGQVKIDPKGKIIFDVVLTDIEGYKAPLEQVDIKWDIQGQIGSIAGKEFSAAESSGVGAIIANFSGLQAGATVQVGLHKILLDGFEESQGKSAVSYPAEVGASFSITPKPHPVYTGQYSGKLSYDFSTSSAAARATYLTFYSDNGLLLPAGTEKIGLWVYGQHQGHWLRAIVKDADGKEHTLDLAKEINWSDWKWVEASLPKVKEPVSLKRIYVVTTDPSKTDAGSIYFDDLTAMISGVHDTSLVPKIPVLKDSANKPTEIGGTVIGAFGDLLLNSSYDKSYEKTIQMAAQIFAQHNTKMNLIAGISSVEGKHVSDYEATAPLNIFKTAGSGYSTYIDNGVSYIFLDSSKGGLRATDYNQWIKFQQDLTSLLSKTNTLFVVMDRSPDAFSDPLEGDLLKKILSEHANNYAQFRVLHGSYERFSKQMENGVHYAAIPGVKSKEPSAVIFNIKDNKVSYQVHPIIEKIVNETPFAKKDVSTDLKVYGITPTKQKILLGYPYAVGWKFPSDKINVINPDTPTIKGLTAGSANITVKTKLAEASFNIDITDVTVIVNGKEVVFPDQQPYINKNNRTMVPVRFVSESLGANVGLNNTTKTVTITKDAKNIMLTIGSNTAVVDGKAVNFDTKAEFKNDRNMVPLRFISEVLGADVSWDPDTRTVNITQ